MRHARTARNLRLTPEARRERRRNIVRGVALSVAILAVTLALVTAGVIVALGHGPSEVVVPNIVGQTFDQATATLKRVGLEGKQMSEIFSDKVDEGVVAKQRPDPQMTVKQGRLIELTVSRGPKSVKVPALVGKSVTEAQEFLQRSYLKLGDLHRIASGEPADTVLVQTPEAGTVVDRDSKVNLQASGGADFGTWRTSGGQKWVFMRLTLVVPAGEDMQGVRVVLESDNDETVYDELHRPGEKVSLDIRGKRGTQVKVYLEEKKVFEQELR
jgi:eukaryotic-like serine/threonine-protein kinase